MVTARFCFLMNYTIWGTVGAVAASQGAEVMMLIGAAVAGLFGMLLVGGSQVRRVPIGSGKRK